ncbi:MAG: DUF2920 family protein [Clostridiales bacterium]|nr:DUF2920 family protein [Clostridiales bacterium]
MAKEYELEIYGQPSLYGKDERTFKIYFSEPDTEINEDTGLLLLIAGYGGNANSNVYKKMRNQFADTYNLVTIQCDYFGYEFMQSNDQFPITKEVLEESLPQKDSELLVENFDAYQYILNGKELKGKIDLGETLDNFNDLGLIQMIDNLTAIKVVMDIIEQNGLHFNQNKIIAYGQSHGAYLSYLCNAFAPNLFSAIIDNSAYIYPTYLEESRFFAEKVANCLLIKIYDYLISSIVFDKEIYHLDTVYKQFKNQAIIISFQGSDDNMVLPKVKRDFLDTVDKSTMEYIDEKRLDGEIFKSTTHSLNVDILKLFEYVEKTYPLQNKEVKGIFTDVCYATSSFQYEVSNETGVPLLTCLPI